MQGHKPDISEEQGDLLLTLTRKKIPKQSEKKRREDVDKI